MNTISRGTMSDIRSLLRLRTRVIKDMEYWGIKQWTNNYPNEQVLEDDVNHHALYVLKHDRSLIASVTIKPENDPAYQVLSWESNHAMVIHRLMIDPTHMRQGIGNRLFAFAEKLAYNRGYDSIKVDTHPDNYRMLGLIRKNGYIEVGYMASINRIGFEKQLNQH